MHSLRALRLTNRRLFTSATKRLFSDVTVLSTEASALKCRRILEDNELNPLVTKLTFILSPEPVPDPYSPNTVGYAQLPDAYESVVYDMGRFKNLRSVELRFSGECAATHEGYTGLAKDVWETEEFRSTVLKMLFESMNDEDHPASNVRDLTIKNLQDIVDEEVATSEDFKAVLSRLDSLSLQVVVEYRDHSPESSIEIPAPYKFFGKDLTHFWLEPVQQQLTHLKLFATTYWGYLPYCNVYNLQFPKLKSLILGNMTFTHERQLEWLLAHGKTLESLIMDDCPIIHAAKLHMSIDAERYPTSCDHRGVLMGTYDQAKTWIYEARWHNHLCRLKDGLPHLKRFGFGSGQWLEKTAFDDASQLPAEITYGRYCIFDQGTGPSAWIEPDLKYRWAPSGATATRRCKYDCCWNEHPEYPDCAMKDQEALKELVDAARSRC